jgi:hypothetical protein
MFMLCKNDVRFPFCFFKNIVEGTTSDSITSWFFEVLIIGGGLGKERMVNGLVSFGANGMSLF